MNKNLLARQEQQQEQIQDLKDQLRDVMFFLEARDKISTSGLDSEDIRDSQVTLIETDNKPPNRSSSSSRRKGKLRSRQQQ